MALLGLMRPFLCHRCVDPHAVATGSEVLRQGRCNDKSLNLLMQLALSPYQAGGLGTIPLCMDHHHMAESHRTSPFLQYFVDLMFQLLSSQTAGSFSQNKESLLSW